MIFRVRVARAAGMVRGVDRSRPPVTDWLTLPEAARRLRLSRNTLRAAIRDGGLPAYRISGRWWRVSRGELDRWVRRHHATPTAHARARVAEVLAREAGGP